MQRAPFSVTQRSQLASIVQRTVPERGERDTWMLLREGQKAPVW
jgi:hypothetical protein